MDTDFTIPLGVAFPADTLEIATVTTHTLLFNSGCADKHAVRVLLQTVAPAIKDITKQYKVLFTIPDEVLADERAAMCLLGLYSTSRKQVVYWGFKSLYWIKCQCTADGLQLKQLQLSKFMCKQVDLTLLKSRWAYSGTKAHPAFDWSNSDLLSSEASLHDLATWLNMRLELLEYVALARQTMESKAGTGKSLMQVTEEMKISQHAETLLCPTSKKAVLLEARSLYCWRLVWTVFRPNSETRRELVDRWRMLEMDLFTIRSCGCAKDHVSKLVDMKSAARQSVHELPPDLQTQCRALDPVCTSWLSVPFEAALRVAARHRCILHKGTAYIPTSSVLDVARERYSHWLAKLVDTRVSEYKNLVAMVQSDKRMLGILREFVSKFYHRLSPSVRSNSSIDGRDLYNLSTTAQRTDSWMPPCMQQLAMQKHLKNNARLTYAHYLFRSGATLAQVRQHFLPKFEHAYPPQEFVKEWKTIRGELDWNFKHKMRPETNCEKLMHCGMCPLRTGGTTNNQQAKMQCASLAKKRHPAKDGQLIVRAPRDFSVFVLSL